MWTFTVPESVYCTDRSPIVAIGFLGRLLPKAHVLDVSRLRHVRFLPGFAWKQWRSTSLLLQQPTTTTPAHWANHARMAAGNEKSRMLSQGLQSAGSHIAYHYISLLMQRFKLSHRSLFKIYLSDKLFFKRPPILNSKAKFDCNLHDGHVFKIFDSPRLSLMVTAVTDIGTITSHNTKIIKYKHAGSCFAGAEAPKAILYP